MEIGFGLASVDGILWAALTHQNLKMIVKFSVNDRNYFENLI